MLECEINADAKLSVREIVAVILAAVWPLVWACLGVGIVAALLTGCRAFYENGGSSIRIGELTAPIEVSDGTDSVSVRLLYSMDGAAIYTRKDSKVTVVYDNTYTNTYIGCIDKKVTQHLKVDVEPLYVGEDPDTNSVESASTSVTP